MPGFRISADPREFVEAMRTVEKVADQAAKGGGKSWSGFNSSFIDGLRRQGQAVESEYQKITRSISNAVKSLPVPGLGPVGGLLGAAGIGAGISKAITDYIALADATKKLADESGATAERMSTLIGIAGELGATADSLSNGFKGLKENMNTEEGQRQLQNLGIASKDLEGNARPVIDVFDDLRRRFAGAKLDAGTLQVAQDLLGRDYRDLIPILELTDAQYQQLAQRVADLGEVMDAEGIRKAKEFELTMHEGSATLLNFGQVAVPFATNMVQGLVQVFDTLGTFARNAWDAISGKGGSFNPLDAIDQAQKRHDQLVARIKASAAAIVNPTGGTGSSLGFATKAADQAAQSAIQDRISAVQKLADEEQRRLQKALAGYEKERQTAIDTIESEETAREKAHNSDINAIQKEVDARDWAYQLRQRQRDDEVAGLRDEINATQQLLDLENDRRAIADAERTLAHERTVRVTREQFATALDYERAVTEQNRRVKDAETKLADAKTKLAQDTARQQIEARINAIQREGELEKRSLDDYKHDADERIAKIRQQMAIEKEQADAKVKALQSEMSQERDRVQTAIEGLQEQTRVTVDELQKQLKGYQDFASGAATAIASIPSEKTVTIRYQTLGASSAPGDLFNPNRSPDANAAAMGTDQNSGANVTIYSAAQLQALARQYLGRDLSPTELAQHLAERSGELVNQVIHDYRNSAEGQAYEMAAGGGGGGGVHDFPHTMTFGEPVVMVGRSGKNYGEIAKTGSEDVTFHGVGGGRGGGGVVFSPSYQIDGRSLAELRRHAHEAADTAMADFEAALTAENSYGARRVRR